MGLDDAHIIDLPKVQDPRGNLSFIQSGDHVPFDIARVYWIYDVPGGKHRHGHAFRHNAELIVALAGSFDVVLSDGTESRRIHLSRSYYGLYVPPMTWREIDNFSTCSVALVLASETYDPDDYIYDKDEYRRIIDTAHRLKETGNE